MKDRIAAKAGRKHGRNPEQALSVLPLRPRGNKTGLGPVLRWGGALPVGHEARSALLGVTADYPWMSTRTGIGWLSLGGRFACRCLLQCQSWACGIGTAGRDRLHPRRGQRGGPVPARHRVRHQQYWPAQRVAVAGRTSGGRAGRTKSIRWPPG